MDLFPFGRERVVGPRKLCHLLVVERVLFTAAVLIQASQCLVVVPALLCRQFLLFLFCPFGRRSLPLVQPFPLAMNAGDFVKFTVYLD